MVQSRAGAGHGGGDGRHPGLDSGGRPGVSRPGLESRQHRDTPRLQSQRPGGPIAQDVATAAAADQARKQRTSGINHFLDGYRMMDYGQQPDFSADVTTFMSKDSTFWLETDAAYNSLPVTHADQAAKDRVTAIAATHAAADPAEASLWNAYRDEAINGSADDVRRFIQYDGWPTVAPVPGTPEFRNEVESLKARWAGGDPSNPMDPADVLIGVEGTAWAEWQAEWQAELNAQAQPRADILAAEMQALDALKAGAETMHDGLDYAWTAGGILWAENQKTSGADPVGWSDVDISHAPHDLDLIKAKVAALASAAQDAATKAVAARNTAYATATGSGLPEGRGLTYAVQSVQVTLAAAAAAQATSNAMQTAVAATNATLADSATLLANASAQAHAARALYLRETAQDNAAQAQALATQAKYQEVPRPERDERGRQHQVLADAAVRGQHRLPGDRRRGYLRQHDEEGGEQRVAGSCGQVQHQPARQHQRSSDRQAVRRLRGQPAQLRRHGRCAQQRRHETTRGQDCGRHQGPGRWLDRALSGSADLP